MNSQERNIKNAVARVLKEQGLTIKNADKEELFNAVVTACIDKANEQLSIGKWLSRAFAWQKQLQQKTARRRKKGKVTVPSQQDPQFSRTGVFGKLERIQGED